MGEESRKSMSSFLYLRIYGYNPVGIQWIKKNNNNNLMAVVKIKEDLTEFGWLVEIYGDGKYYFRLK